MRIITLFLLFFSVCSMTAQAADATRASKALRGTYASLSEALRNNQFNRALHLNSEESPHSLKGEIHAVIDYPYNAVREALTVPAHWCDVLILHINVKYCRATHHDHQTVLTVSLGKKHPQPLEDAYQVAFDYQQRTATPEYFSIELNAEQGPLNTRNYRIWVEAVSLDAGRTFLHFTYAYEVGMAGRLAMKSYLATAGSNKVGFTVTGRHSDGRPLYIRGVRGVIERNSMRYYLAIDAYLAGLKAPVNEQFERRLRAWYRATENYPRQLHEVAFEDYLHMKRDEYQRQQIKE